MLQTPAERYMIEAIKKELRSQSGTRPAILNIGAGNSVTIEDYIASEGLYFFCDRVDVIDCDPICQKYASRVWKGSIESCPQIPSGSYDLAFANYVLEHVAELKKAAREIKRILKPGGVFIVSTPNPAAPEFRLAKYTPLWVHQLIRGKNAEAFETFYAYRDVRDLVDIFRSAGFSVREEFLTSFTFGYLHRFPIICFLSRIYDRIINWVGSRNMKGNAAVIFSIN